MLKKKQASAEGTGTTGGNQHSATGVHRPEVGGKQATPCGLRKWNRSWSTVSHCTVTVQTTGAAHNRAVICWLCTTSKAQILCQCTMLKQN